MEKRDMNSSSTIYLDHATLAPPSHTLFSQMERFAKKYWQSSTAPYLQGKEPFASIESSIEMVQTLIGAHATDSFQFCSSGMRALSEVYHSIYTHHMAENGKNHALIGQGEERFGKILEPFSETLGVYSSRIPIDTQGRVTPDALREAITPKTGFVSLSWAHSLTGVVQPIEELGAICREKGILFHVDASQVLGKLYFKFQDLPIDYLTFEGTVIHGPKGSGALFAKKTALFQGMLSEEIQEDTLNLPALIGLGIAAKELMEAFEHLCLETFRLKERFERHILRSLPKARVLFKEAMRLPTITCLVFPSVMGELLAFHLRERGVIASFKTRDTLARFLREAQFDRFESECALTFSLSYTTTEEEVERAAHLVVDAVQNCQTFSGGIFQ